VSTINTYGLPPINPALEPASVRNGNQAAKNAYQTGLAFEQVLVDQLSQQLSSTAGGASSDGSSDSSGDASGASSGGLMGSDPASSMYGQMLPQALSTSVMSAGGLGLAAPLAAAIDPSIKATR
jgi:Rod binding domain-containing protein